MTNYIQSGNTITITAPRTVLSGEGVLLGNIFGIANNAATSADTDLEITRRGVFDIAKDSSVPVAGYPAYWDNSGFTVTAVPNGTRPIGAFAAAALTGDATGRVAIGLVIGGPLTYVSAERTATGSAETVAHGMGVKPSAVLIVPTDTSPAVVGVFTVTEGSHTSANVVVTVTASKKYKILAFA